MKFLATVLPSSLEVRGELPSHLQFPQGHLLFWVAAHVNWMQHDFFLQEVFQQVEKSDWYQDKSRYRCRYKCRWLQIVEHCRSAVVFFCRSFVCFMIPLHWGPVMCYPDPHSAGGPNGGLPFRLKLIVKIMKQNQKETCKNLEFYQFHWRVQMHWKHGKQETIFLKLVLW